MIFSSTDRGEAEAAERDFVRVLDAQGPNGYNKLAGGAPMEDPLFTYMLDTGRLQPRKKGNMKI